MTRPTLGPLALAGLLLLAGCGGIMGPASTPTDDANGTATTSATPVTEEGPQPIYETPLSAATVLDEHEAALDDAETFTYEQHSTVHAVERGRLLQQTNVTAAVDLATDRTLVVQNVTLQGESVAYGNRSAGYERIATGGGVRYRRAPENVTNPAFYARPPIDRYIRGLNYTYRGATERNGSTVFTYVVGSTDQLTPSEHGLGVIPPENVTSIDSRLSVLADGRIESFEYHARGVRNGYTLDYSVSVEWTRVGETTVSEPDWVSDARNATSG